LVLRLQIGYPTEIVATGVVGACAEAALGGWLLRRLRVEGGFARLSDVLGLILVAMLAPTASIALSWLGRLWLDQRFLVPFHSGWEGWWRMNALGVLVLVPLYSTVSRARQTLSSRARRVEAALFTAATLAIVAGVMSLRRDGVVTLLLLDGALATGLVAAVRLGPTGAAWVAALGSLSIVMVTDKGLGPFLALPIEERHDALQFFTLALASIPLLLGALIAERELELSRRVSSEAARRAIEQLLPDVTCRVRADATLIESHLPANASAAGPVLQPGRSLAELAPEHDAGRLREAIRSAHAGGAVTSIEIDLSLGGGRQACEARLLRAGPDEVLCLVRDISARKRTEAVGDWHARVLELIAKGRPSNDALRTLVDGIEAFTAGATASLLVLEGTRLRVAISNSLPPAYNAALDGVEIGPAVGSCGTAAYHRRSVIVSDIQTDPLWRDYQQIAQPFGLRACWSVPVRSATRAVLGTFAVYFREPRGPVRERRAGAHARLRERAGADGRSARVAARRARTPQECDRTHRRSGLDFERRSAAAAARRFDAVDASECGRVARR
jgi:integral membrane sensor domain MASE1